MKCCFCCCCCYCCCCCCCPRCWCYCYCWSHKPSFKVWLKSGQEQLRYWWHWVCGGGGGGGGWWWWSKVIFMSHPTFELSCGWVGVVTKIWSQKCMALKIWFPKVCSKSKSLFKIGDIAAKNWVPKVWSKSRPVTAESIYVAWISVTMTLGIC